MRHWGAAHKHGWVVALPQSPQEYAPDIFSWNDWDWVVPTVVENYEKVCKSYPVNEAQTILAGFSMGACVAISLALEQTIKVKGLLCVAPYFTDVEELSPLLAKIKGRRFRVYLVASKDDEFCYEVAVKLAQLLEDYGIEHKLDIYPAVGHSFPPQFEERIPEALAYLLDD